MNMKKVFNKKELTEGAYRGLGVAGAGIVKSKIGNMLSKNGKTASNTVLNGASIVLGSFLAGQKKGVLAFAGQGLIAEGFGSLIGSFVPGMGMNGTGPMYGSDEDSYEDDINGAVEDSPMFGHDSSDNEDASY